MPSPNRRQLALWALSTTALAGCGRAASGGYEPTFGRAPATGLTECSFAVHPLHNPVRLHKIYHPLMAYLRRRIPRVRFNLVASRDYATFDERLGRRMFDFALPNPLQAVRASGQGYRIFGKVADDSQFRGVILVRRTSEARKPVDLAGRTISYPAPTALAATMMNQYFLQTHGLPKGAARSLYVGSQESAINSVYLGASDAAGTWPAPWNAFQREHPGEAATLEVRWSTPTLVNNALVVRDSVPQALADQVLAALTTLGDNEPGQLLLDSLSMAGFEAADDGDYDPVRAFLRDFETVVGPIDAPR